MPEKNFNPHPAMNCRAIFRCLYETKCEARLLLQSQSFYSKTTLQATVSNSSSIAATSIHLCSLCNDLHFKRRLLMFLFLFLLSLFKSGFDRRHINLCAVHKLLDGHLQSPYFSAIPTDY